MSLNNAVKNLPKGNIYLAPKNTLTELLATELRAIDVKISGFIDQFQKGKDVFTARVIRENSNTPTTAPVILIFSPNYKKEILHSLGKKNTYFVEILDGVYNFISAEDPFANIIISLNKLNHYVRYYQSTLKNSVYSNLNNGRFITSQLFKNTLSQKRNIKRGFVICNGPSLPVEILPHLNCEITIGCNKIYLATKDVKWSPTFYTIQDKLVMRNLHDNVRGMHFENLVLPSYHLKSQSPIKSAFYFKTTLYQEVVKKGERIFSDELFGKGLTLGHTTLFLMIQFLASIGCKEIYILGADFDYKLEKNLNGSKYLFDVDGNHHFSKNYRPSNEVWASPQYDKMMEQASIFQKQSSQLGYHIYNLSSTSKLPAFPHISIEKVLSK